jgi:hypothetical protein
MGTLWRSEPMHLVQLFVQLEAAHATVDELGQLGVIQFLDVRTFSFLSPFFLSPSLSPRALYYYQPNF